MRFLQKDDYHKGYLKLELIEPVFSNQLHWDIRHNSFLRSSQKLDEKFPLDFDPKDEIDFQKQIELFESVHSKYAKLMVIERYGEIVGFTFIEWKKQIVDEDLPHLDRMRGYIAHIKI